MNKIKCLCWADSPTAFTGFGTVARNILSAIHSSGKYEIHQFAINFDGSFVDRDKFPWQLNPARLMNPEDPYGKEMFLKIVAQEDYDIIWILNDTFVTHSIADILKKICKKKKDIGRKVPRVIYYYPVDCRVKSNATGLIEIADFPIAYTEHGFQETIKTLPHLKDKLQIIHHGSDTKKFFPFSKRIISILKKEIFNIDPNSYLIINVNRNTARKQMTQTLLCFKEFRKKHPDTYLYLHANPFDRGIDLIQCMNELGFELNKEVFMPPNYSSAHGVSDEILNQLYNCGDMFLTNHLGEGWGLTVTEAMACGLPVVAPNNSSMPEIIGNDRGYLYPCKEKIYIDTSGYRPMGLISDILIKMEEVYQAGWKHNNPRVIKARKWVEKNDWQLINQKWLSIFETASIEQKQEKLITEQSLGEML